MRTLFETHVRDAVRYAEKALESPDPVKALGYLYLAYARLKDGQRHIVIEAQDAERVEEEVNRG